MGVNKVDPTCSKLEISHLEDDKHQCKWFLVIQAELFTN
jgi:hypothetical protein